MSQEQKLMTATSVRKQRRTRQRRGQPTLITTTEAQQSLPQISEQDLEIEGDKEPDAMAETMSSPQTKSLAHLPKFFSRIDKSEQKEEELVQAHLARQDVSTAPPSKTNNGQRSERREPLFKVRHFVGMTIYLFGAEIILPYEFSLAHYLGIDRVYPLTIFSFTIPLSSALFLNIATLILLLYVLVKLDLLPNTTSARLRAEQQAKARQQKNAHHAVAAVKQTPPPMRLGVQGQDDDLYRAYRTKQRQEKKR